MIKVLRSKIQGLRSLEITEVILCRQGKRMPIILTALSSSILTPLSNVRSILDTQNRDCLLLVGTRSTIRMRTDRPNVAIQTGYFVQFGNSLRVRNNVTQHGISDHETRNRATRNNMAMAMQGTLPKTKPIVKRMADALVMVTPWKRVACKQLAIRKSSGQQLG